ncbi:chorismate mutase [Acholeplasma granularum]|uniref:chorismate mutase n=1 Tax=Acholeplasma granularum TaxID=264635 RepID=UPI0004B21AF5|nr:chorismate mutase [Acholeplasma granularum]
MTLKELRKRIDQLDYDIVKLLELRFQVVKEIGAYKKEHQLPIYDPKREEEVLQSKKELILNKEQWPYYEEIFKLIMDISKRLEK